MGSMGSTVIDQNTILFLNHFILFADLPMGSTVIDGLQCYRMYKFPL